MESQNNIPDQETKKYISTSTGLVVLSFVVIAVLLAVFFYFDLFSGEKGNGTEPMVVAKPQETAKSVENNTVVPAVVTTPEAPATVKTTIDFNAELKELDKGASSVDYADFADTQLSDTNLGL
jgi:hypothetical protein